MQILLITALEKLSNNIVQAAFLKFIQFGIRSISIDDICNELRISKKTLYRIFPKKEDLVEAVLHHHSELIKESFEKLQRNKNAIEALVVIINEVKKHSNDNVSAFYYDLEKYYPVIFAKHQEQKTHWIRSSFDSNLRQGIAEGFYRDDLDIEMGSIFHAVSLNNMKATLDLFPKMSFKRLTEFYVEIIVRLITNEKGLKYIQEHTKKE